MRRESLVIILAFAMAFAAALSGCGGKTEEGGNTAPAALSASGAKSEPQETVITAATKEEAKKLAEAFYGGIAKANPISMSLHSDGKLVSEFAMNGDTIYSGAPDMDFAYYAFIEDGTKYLLGGDEDTAYESEYMYDMLAESVQTTLDMFVLGYYDADDDGALQFSATQTDKTVNGTKTSQLVTIITGEEDGKTATVKATGTAENGAVSNIICEIDSGEEKGTLEYRFTYKNVSIDLPAYTIDENYNAYGVTIEGTHVDSPYKTLGELIATLDEDENLTYVIEDERIYAIGEKDGRHYQFVAPFPEAEQAALDRIDFFSDSYDEERYAILGKLVVDDCVDFTDAIIPQSELDAFVGRTAQDIADAGYELTGWSVGEEGAHLTLEKDGMDYEAVTGFPEGYTYDPDAEFEAEDAYGFPVEAFYFDTPEYVALPIQ